MSNAVVFLLALNSLNSRDGRRQRDLDLRLRGRRNHGSLINGGQRLSENCAKQIFQSFVAEFTDAKR